ncbi:MAG: DUF1028 domain-containing protein [Acidimicrobiales bacterium]
MRSLGPRGRRLLATVTVLAALSVASPASATWSLVAVDPETGEVGAAIASCVPPQALGPLDQPLFPLAVMPGEGAAVVQGQVSTDATVQIRNLVVDEGLAAVPTLAFVTAPEFDDQVDARQYAIVLLPANGALAADVAAESGESLSSVALDRQGDLVSVQGNLLVGDSVVDDALAAFNASDGDLTERLAAGLAAGAEAGGDRRCGDQTALFAQLVVAAPSEAPGIDLDTGVPDLDQVLTVVASSGGDNPVTILADRVAAGERSGVILPEADGNGALVAVVVGFAAVAFVGGGFLFWRAAYRRPMPAR